MENLTDRQSRQLQSIEKKRHLLASLMRIARDISGHSHSLSNAQLLARPSQNYPPKAQEFKRQVDRYLLLLQEPDLKLRSPKYDQQSSLLLDALMEFVDIAEQQVERDQAPDEFTDDMQHQLKEFGLVTKVAVVLRILLQEYGVILPPVKFSVPQEWLGEQITLLNDTNHHLRLKASDKIAEVLLDIVSLQSDETLPPTLRDTLEYVHDAMTENLEYLEHGGNMAHLPYEFEALEITELPEETIRNHLEQKQTISVQAKVENTEQKLKFNEKMKLWLNTPWSKRWRDLE